MSQLKIHFLNVGHGDCTIIQFPSGRNMMIDINNSKAIEEDEEKELIESAGLSYLEFVLSKSLINDSVYKFSSKKGIHIPEPIDPLDYVKSLGITSIFRYVQSHPDMDHMSGLYRLHSEEQEGIEIENFWDTDHEKEQDFSGFGGKKFDARDWDEYQKLRKSSENPKSLQYYRGSSNKYYTEDGITILAPTKELVEKANEKDDYNKLSYVLLVEYAGHKIVLGGDGDKEVWQDILDNCSDSIKNVSVLKASHHGRDSCFHEEAVKLMNPQYTVCSVGKKPSTDAHNKYRKHTQQKVLSTRFRGNIVLTINEDGTGEIDWTDNKEEE